MTDQPTSNITFHDSRYEFGEQVIRLDKEGFHYRGQFIADAGEAHRLMVEYLRQQTQPKPQGLAMRRLLNAPIDNRGYVDLRERSRPEPQGQQGPTDAELLETAADAVGYEHVPTDETCLSLARAVLARWGRPTIEPVPTTDGEVAEMVRDLRYMADNCDVASGFEAWGPTLIRVADLIEARPAIEPVPVAERLPGPEDCAPWPDEPDANPWCWTGKEVDGGWEWDQIGMLGVDAKNLGRVLGGGGWTHWLPHHALPVPQQEAE